MANQKLGLLVVLKKNRKWKRKMNEYNFIISALSKQRLIANCQCSININCEQTIGSYLSYFIIDWDTAFA